jgi:hypothetical protein
MDPFLSGGAIRAAVLIVCTLLSTRGAYGRSKELEG